MAEGETRNSMDDVLASIRRIVRAEREANESGTDNAVILPDNMDGGTGDSPLALTPEMMSETDDAPDEPLREDFPAPGERASELATFVRAPDSVGGDTEAPAATPGLQMDNAALRDLIREIIREELASGEAERLVRGIIKAELTTGDIGANISRNVLRLIRSEVAKARG